MDMPNGLRGSFTLPSRSKMSITVRKWDGEAAEQAAQAAAFGAQNRSSTSGSWQLEETSEMAKRGWRLSREETCVSKCWQEREREISSLSNHHREQQLT